MTTTEAIAHRTLGNMPPPKDGKPESVILTILVVIAVVKLAISLYDCWEGNLAVSLGHCRNPGILQRWRLKRVVKKVLVAEGRRDQVNPMFQALLETGKTITAHELGEAIRETHMDQNVDRDAKRYGLA